MADYARMAAYRQRRNEQRKAAGLDAVGIAVPLERLGGLLAGNEGVRRRGTHHSPPRQVVRPFGILFVFSEGAGAQY